MALCGSLRLRSSNRTLLLAAQKHAPEGMDVAIFESIRDLPHFNPDLDGPELDPEDRPEGVLRLRRELAASDALLISTPEYAHGLPGSLKNALDWLVSKHLERKDRRPELDRLMTDARRRRFDIVLGLRLLERGCRKNPSAGHHAGLAKSSA